MICPKCGGGGKVYCTMCKGTGLYHEEDGITNEEWLRSCTTEQLAESLNKIFTTKSFCHICPDNNVCDLGYECKYEDGEVEDFRKWLKQPHRGVAE